MEPWESGRSRGSKRPSWGGRAHTRGGALRTSQVLARSRPCDSGTPGCRVLHRSARCSVMPTTNPRVNVTLSPSLDLLLQRMAAYTRTSKSQVLRELLEAAEPGLQRAAALMEAAERASDDIKQSFAASMGKAQATAERAAARSLAALDSAQQDLVSQAEAVRERRPSKRSGAAGTPRPLKGGSSTPRRVKSAV